MTDILLVDDEPFLLNAASRYLRLAKFTIYTAKDAQQAKYVLKSRSIDVVVSDHKMPGTCGIELLYWTANHFPKAIRILLTGCATSELLGQNRNAVQIHRFFKKPCEHESLEATIRAELHAGRQDEPQRLQITEPASRSAS